MTALQLTAAQARRFVLRHQGLLPPRAAAGKEGVLALLERVGCIQFDPLNVVGRNPDLVLQSRIADYSPALLEEMLYTDRSLVDGWDKMAAIYPVADRPHLIHHQRVAAERSPWNNDTHVRDVVPQVRAEMEARGPLASIDLAHDHKVDWAWGPTRVAKVALEDMFSRGETIIHHKEGTRKYYDFAARHLPADIAGAPDPHGSLEDYQDWHFLRRIRGTGLAWDRGSTIWHGIYGGRSLYGFHGTAQRTAALERLAGRGETTGVRIAGVRFPFFMATRDLSELEDVINNDAEAPQAAVIAPLDNLLWDRDMVRALFGFEYRWEVYKPVKDRRWGYYVLPVLLGDRFVARFEPAVDAKAGALVVKNWWWEPEASVSRDRRDALRDCFEHFAAYLGVRKIKVKKSLAVREKLDWLP